MVYVRVFMCLFKCVAVCVCLYVCATHSSLMSKSSDLVAK